MSLITESHDSLPYIDTEPSAEDRLKADKLISTQLPLNYRQTLHPSIPSLPESNFSPLIEKEIDRLGRGAPRQGGIDLSRYEAPEEPSPTETDLDAWRAALRNAYTSASYLSGRHVNLSLLEEFGKNAWLVSNSQLEEILQHLEKDLVELKTQTESVNKARKAAQEGSRGELLGLEDSWKTGVGKMIEVQVAAAALKNEIEGRRRSGAS